jgi:integrase/recombinase XerC
MSTNTTIQTAVQRYLDERRQLGFDLIGAGMVLTRFARYADARHRGALTREIQLSWAREQTSRSSPGTCVTRLQLMRPFVTYYRQFEPNSVVLDPRDFGPRPQRPTPHIYTEQEVCDLLDEAGRLSPKEGLRPATYKALFGLIAATGLRVSEALHLRDADVDLPGASLTVRQTKFNKSRCLPIHSSVVQALGDYRSQRDQAIVNHCDMRFFVSAQGRALPSPTVHRVFSGLRERLGLKPRGQHSHVRIHDLRHTMAVRRVQQWHQDGVTMDHGVFWLCTYLGHVKISDTYWYLTGAPELMAVVGEKFQDFVQGGTDHE